MGDVLKAFSVCFDYYVKYTKILSEFITEIEDPNFSSPIIVYYIDRVKRDSQAEGVSLKEHLKYPLNVNTILFNFIFTFTFHIHISYFIFHIHIHIFHISYSYISYFIFILLIES